MLRVNNTLEFHIWEDNQALHQQHDEGKYYYVRLLTGDSWNQYVLWKKKVFSMAIVMWNSWTSVFRNTREQQEWNEMKKQNKRGVSMEISQAGTKRKTSNKTNKQEQMAIRRVVGKYKDSWSGIHFLIQGVRSVKENARRKQMQACSWRHMWQSRQKFTVNRPRSGGFWILLVFFCILSYLLENGSMY